ncbi:hypothetical protein NP233_g12496 [Leucocoprinus birnbaumii]|uniref:Protein kinase domain-containing protein n=1 Tax=Leucocoprinus birnbaumii TaxID=56174 RepID=A0AAD5VJZ0_9AGAR|nr:hypothetical protein NP233_g12496 [Leucocoprinus birnbaumii]
MMRLCKAAGTYPQNLALQGIQFEPTPQASGSFGDIYQGMLAGYPVSLKVNRVYKRSKHNVKHFISTYAKEAVVWSQLKHPNLLPFYGIFRLDESHGHGRIALVSPWMENGNISEYLSESNPNAARHPLILDIIEGLGYLHRYSIVHGDLKGANILITPEGSACLADFGLSSVDHPDILRWTSVSTITPTGGTIRWQAPELMTPDEDSRPTLKSDIYSVASVIYEVIVGKLPYHEYPNNATVIRQVTLGVLPTKPSPSQSTFLELTEDIWDIMEHCWDTLPESRPTIEELISRYNVIEPSPLTCHRMTEQERFRMDHNGLVISGVGLSTPFSQDFRQRLGGHASGLLDVELELLYRLAD